METTLPRFPMKHNYRPQQSWGKVMFLQASVILLTGGHAWLRGVCGFFRGGMSGFSGGACVGYDEIRSMSGWYACYWNAFLYS